MKIICLNIWGGRVREPLLDFLKKHEDIDVFCLQEVYDNAEGKELVYTDAILNIYEEIKIALPNYKGYYRSHLQDYYGLAIFVKQNILVNEEGEYFVHRQKGYIPTDHVGFHAKNIQYVKISINEKIITVLNFHGLWTGKDKNDTDDRLAQSKKIKEFVNSLDGEKIVCGDFNLNLNTESVKILEQGMVNLVRDNNIISTRTKLYTKPEKYADYIFISSGVKVNTFMVVPDEVSDHSPLLLDFDI